MIDCHKMTEDEVIAILGGISSEANIAKTNVVVLNIWFDGDKYVIQGKRNGRIAPCLSTVV